MIRVMPAQEPTSFDTNVRRPGRAYLRNNPNPSREQFRTANYWKTCLAELCKSYKDICAYSGIWVPTNASVDHYIPKSIRPDLAYEWSNYRLALDKINNYKSDRVGVADPFTIEDGWFVLDFDSFYVLPNSELEPEVKRTVQSTIYILRLNRDEAFINYRFKIVYAYAQGSMSYSHLQEYYPFISRELDRQQLIEVIKTRFA